MHPVDTLLFLNFSSFRMTWNDMLICLWVSSNENYSILVTWKFWTYLWAVPIHARVKGNSATLQLTYQCKLPLSLVHCIRKHTLDYEFVSVLIIIVLIVVQNCFFCFCFSFTCECMHTYVDLQPLSNYPRFIQYIKDIQNGRHDTSTCEVITPQKAVYTQRFTYFTCNTFTQAQICIERPANEN